MSAFHDSEICRSILESMPTGLCVVDMQKKIVLWSDGAEHITGRARHEVIGHSCIAEALLQCDQPGCEFCNEDCPLARAMKTAHSTEAIGFLHHKAGHEIPVRIRAVPVHNAHGSIIGAVETFEDQQQGASLNHHEDGLNLPGCVDELTGVASHAMMLTCARHWEHLLKSRFPSAFFVSDSRDSIASAPISGQTLHLLCCAWLRAHSRVRSGRPTSLAAGLTTNF
jgi:PAS domain S-box-containing protein